MSQASDFLLKIFSLVRQLKKNLHFPVFFRLMELFTYGQVPYPGMHSREVIEQIERGYRMPKPTSHPVPDVVYLLMLQCWDGVPEKRPTFEYLNHYFEGYTVTSEVPYREVQD